MRCYTDTDVADQAFCLTLSHYADIRPTSPITDPITPDALQGTRVTGMIPTVKGGKDQHCCSGEGHLTNMPQWQSPKRGLFVGWLLNLPATCMCISRIDLHRQFYVLPHWDTSTRSNFLPHPVTVHWHRADQSQRWPYKSIMPSAWQGSHWSANF